MARASGGRKSRLAEPRQAQIVRQINTAIGGLAVTNGVLRPIYGRHPFRLALLIIHFLELIGPGQTVGIASRWWRWRDNEASLEPGKLPNTIGEFA